MLEEYGAASAALTLNGVTIDQFGDTDPAVTIDNVEASAVVKRGLGGKAIIHSSPTIPKTVVVNLLPNSDQSRILSALERSRATIQGTWQQIGTDEKVALIDGVITNRGTVGRVSKTGVSDDQFTIEFNDSISA